MERTKWLSGFQIRYLFKRFQSTLFRLTNGLSGFTRQSRIAHFAFICETIGESV
jgi:hypothetical protein